MKTFKLKDSTYQTNITVLYGTLADYNKYVGRRGLQEEKEEDTTGMHVFYTTKIDNYHLIWVSTKEPRIKMINTLAHELIHLVMKRFTYIGIPINKKNDEAFAYFYASLLEQAIKKL